MWLRTKELHTNKEIQGKDLEKSLSDWVLKMTFCACKFIYSWIGFEGSNILLPESMYKTLSAFVKSIVLFLFTWNLCSMISSFYSLCVVKGNLLFSKVISNHCFI